MWKEASYTSFCGKVVFGFSLHVISLLITYVWFFSPIVTLKPEFDHVQIHLNRGLLSLGIVQLCQDGC